MNDDELTMFPENSYTHKCGCDMSFMAPKGWIYCHSCMYKEIEALKAENERLEKECGESQEGFLEYMGLSDHLQIEVDNLKKRIALLTTPDSNIKPEL